MKTTLVFAIAMLFVTALNLPGAQSEPPQDILFYVGPDGADTNSGTENAPFATLEKARKSVRKRIAKGLDANVIVYLRGGIYLLDRPLRFDARDSGTELHSVTYAAYPGETPIFSGGREISGWTRGNGNRWTVTLRDVKRGRWWFRQLFAGGKRLPRGRFPNEGDPFLRIESISDGVTELRLDRTFPGGDLAKKSAELVVLCNWSISRHRVDFTRGALVKTETPVGWIGHDWTTASPGKPAFLEHALEFVDTPGEWYLDRSSGVLTYCAAEGENPSRMTFIAPKLEQLLRVQGKRDAPVRSLHFRGLTFEYTAWPLPKFGYAGLQAGHHGTTIKEKQHVLPLAIEYAYAVDCRMQECRVRHTGACGVGYAEGTQRNLLSGCELNDIGANGVMIGWRGRETLLSKSRSYGLDTDWVNPLDTPVANEVSNCYIHDCGTVSYGAVGIYEAFCIYTRIAHNRVCDMPYTGISTGFRWDSTDTSQRGCRVEYNHVFDVMTKLADGGCIYTLGYQPGGILRGNLLHDVHRSDYAHGGAPNNGIFFDEGTKAFQVIGNIIYDTSGDPTRFNACKSENQTWRANRFGVAPDDPKFPKRAANRAGPLPKYRQRFGF